MERAAFTPVVKPSSPSPGLLMTVMVVGHAIKHMYNAAFFIIMPEIQAAWGLSNTQVGTLSTARSIAGSTSNLPAGFIADRMSHRWPVILGLAMVVVGIFQFVMGIAPSYWPLLAAAVVVNIAISFWHPPAIAALSQQFAHRRGFAIGLHGTGGSIGEALGPVIVGGIVAAISWQTVLQGSAIPAILTGLVVWFLVRDLRGHASGGVSVAAYGATLKRLLSGGPLLMILLVTGGYSMVQLAVATFLPVYLRGELGYDAGQVGWFLFAAQAGGIVSQPLLGLASDRFGRRAVLIPSLLILASGVMIVGIVPAGLPLAAAITLMGAFQFPLMALFLASAMDIVGEEVQATTVSLVFGSGTIFGSISPLLAGSLADSFGVRAVFPYAAALAVIAAGVLFIGGRRR